MRIRRTLVRVIVVVLATLGLLFAASDASATTPLGEHWTGFGAQLKYWKTVHPKNTYRCSAGGCYGYSTPRSDVQGAQFVTVMTADGRVTAYSQDFRSGSIPLAQAKAEVLALFPRDTVTTAVWVNHDSLGNTCVFWNLRSKTLGVWFSAKKIGDPSGAVGVGLEHYPSGANTASLASDSATIANLAVVGIAPNEKGDNC